MEGALGCNLHLSCVGFQYPKATGKYEHPWSKALPPGKARLYTLGHTAFVTLLAGVAAYGTFETFIIMATSSKYADVSTRYIDGLKTGAMRNGSTALVCSHFGACFFILLYDIPLGPFT